MGIEWEGGQGTFRAAGPVLNLDLGDNFIQRYTHPPNYTLEI